MATIEKYQTASGTTLYRVRYRKPDRGQTMKSGFPTKHRAKEFAASVEHKKRAGEYISTSLGRITVGELAPVWLARKRQATAPSTYRTLESAWRIHVEPVWGRVSVAGIDAGAIEAWIAAMGAQGAGATTVLRAYGVLSGILAVAVKSRRLAINPAKGVENLPRKNGKRHIYLTATDVAALADASGPHGALVLVLAYTGLRWGEAIGLRVRDVEFLRRRLNVHENAVQIGAHHAVGPTKGREARSVPVPGFVLDELSAQCAGKAPGELVFPARGGYLPRPKSSNGWFIRAVRKTGVQTITPHDLRHTCASLAVSAGVNVLALARMLGHKDPSVTLRVYADLFDEDLDAVAAALHARYGTQRPARRQL